MPLSFQGFGAMAIIGMVLILAAVQGVEYLRERSFKKKVGGNSIRQ